MEYYRKTCCCHSDRLRTEDWVERQDKAALDTSGPASFNRWLIAFERAYSLSDVDWTITWEIKKDHVRYSYIKKNCTLSGLYKQEGTKMTITGNSTTLRETDTLSLSLSLSHTQALTLRLSLTHSHTFTQFVSVCPSCSYTGTHTLSVCLWLKADVQ